MYRVADISVKGALPIALNKDGHNLLAKSVRFWVLFSILNHKKVKSLGDHLLNLFAEDEENMEFLKKELQKLQLFPEKENKDPMDTVKMKLDFREETPKKEECKPIEPEPCQPAL